MVLHIIKTRPGQFYQSSAVLGRSTSINHCYSVTMGKQASNRFHFSTLEVPIHLRIAAIIKKSLNLQMMSLGTNAFFAQWWSSLNIIYAGIYRIKTTLEQIGAQSLLSDIPINTCQYCCYIDFRDCFENIGSNRLIGCLDTTYMA